MATDTADLAATVAELRALLGKATPGPWRWNSYSGIAAQVPEGHPLEDYEEGDPADRGIAWICWIDGGPRQKGHGDQLRLPEARANAELIERLRNAAPALLAALAAATAERDAALGHDWTPEEMMAVSTLESERDRAVAENDRLRAALRQIKREARPLIAYEPERGEWAAGWDAAMARIAALAPDGPGDPGAGVRAGEGQE